MAGGMARSTGLHLNHKDLVRLGKKRNKQKKVVIDSAFHHFRDMLRIDRAAEKVIKDSFSCNRKHL